MHKYIQTLFRHVHAHMQRGCMPSMVVTFLEFYQNVLLKFFFFLNDSTQYCSYNAVMELIGLGLTQGKPNHGKTYIHDKDMTSTRTHVHIFLNRISK